MMRDLNCGIGLRTGMRIPLSLNGSTCRISSSKWIAIGHRRKLSMYRSSESSRLFIVFEVPTVLRWAAVDTVDMADFQHHPYPDSRFAKIFEETIPALNCTPVDQDESIHSRRQNKGLWIFHGRR